jgi:thioredoxin 1
MKFYKLLFFLIPGFTLIQCTTPQAQSQILKPHAFLKAIASESDLLIVDVRSPQEYQEGHLESAVNNDWNGPAFKAKANAWNRNASVFVYCLSGGRSASAAEYLRSLHFKNVVELQGGLMAWRSAQLPEQGIIKKNGMTESDFNEGLKSKKDSVLVDFYADWCKPCQLMKPDIADIQHNFDSRIDVWRIDADAETELCRNLNIDALPVLQLYVNGKRTWEHRGYIKASKLREVLGLR